MSAFLAAIDSRLLPLTTWDIFVWKEEFLQEWCHQ